MINLKSIQRPDRTGGQSRSAGRPKNSVWAVGYYSWLGFSRAVSASQARDCWLATTAERQLRTHSALAQGELGLRDDDMHDSEHGAESL